MAQTQAPGDLEVKQVPNTFIKMGLVTLLLDNGPKLAVGQLIGWWSGYTFLGSYWHTKCFFFFSKKSMYFSCFLVDFFPFLFIVILIIIFVSYHAKKILVRILLDFLGNIWIFSLYSLQKEVAQGIQQFWEEYSEFYFQLVL